jgi:hypothetical protein
VARKRHRDVHQVERDARAVDLRRAGLTYRQIAAELDLSVSCAHDAVQRGLADSVVETNEEVRRLELDRLDHLARTALKVIAKPHLAVSQGRVVKHPATGEPLADDGPALAAIDRLLKIQDRRARLLGLDAPTRTRVEVIDDDIAQVLVAQLEADLAALTTDQGGGHTEDPATHR